MAKIKQGQLDDEIVATLRKVAAEVCDSVMKKSWYWYYGKFKGSKNEDRVGQLDEADY